MQIRLLFFASYRDLAGSGEISVELPQASTVTTLIDEIRGRGHGFARLPERPAVAVNREYAPLDRTLEEGDEVAFLPPVAGG